MDKLRMESLDMTEQNIGKIGALFPNVITEALDVEKSTPENKVYKKAINFELLKQILSDDVLSGDEAYEFTWVGKKASIVEAGKPIRKTLRPCKEESKDWDTTENLYIEGDNLDVLKLLQESYLGKVKMIYIDPPYNTGNDFVYLDDFKTTKDEYDEEAGVYDEEANRLFRNTESNGRFHSDWCSMMYPRLQLARNLLTDDGVIFIHIDEHEVYNLQSICSEVFGVANELGSIIWDKRNPKGSTAGVAYQHETIIVYSKSKEIFANTPFLKKKEHAELMLSKVDSFIKQKGQVDNIVREQYKSWLRENKSEFTGGELAYNLIDSNGIIYQPVSMAAPDKPETRSHRPLIHPETKKPCPVPAKGWRYTDETMNELIIKNKIEFGIDETIQPRQRYYLKDNIFEAFPSLLYYGGSDDAMGLPFENPKPPFVATKIIDSVCKSKNDLILDFFSGSATTAHAVMQLNAEDGGNRKFICVQLPEPTDEKSEAAKAGYKNICEIGKERIRRAGNKIKEEAGLTAQNLDIGFRVLKLDSTNMKDVYYSANEYTQGMLGDLTSNIKDDRNDLDLLYGCLLEWGIPLSLPHTSEDIGGVTVHTINNGDLIACFAEKISDAVVKEIAGRKPLRVVLRDSSFSSSPEKINVEEIFKLMAPNTTVKVL